MPLRVWRIGLTVVVCDGCGREERREDRPSGFHVLLRSGWHERDAGDHVEMLCPRCAAEPAQA